MNVKYSTRGRPAGGKSKLTRESIVLAAREWLLHDNKRLNIRGLARKLGVDPMAIYHYFENKSALLEATTVSVMQEVYTPISATDWKTELAKLCRSYVDLLKNNPVLLETLLSMGEAVLKPAEMFRERLTIATAPLAIEESLKKTALDLLVDYLHGFVLAIHYAMDERRPVVGDMERPLALYFRSLESLVEDNGDQTAGEG